MRPTSPAYVEIEWQNGVPTAVNGVEMPLVELIGSLETIAGVHGVGRIDMVENRAGRHQVARDLRSARGAVAAPRRIASSKGSSFPRIFSA